MAVFLGSALLTRSLAAGAVLGSLSGILLEAGLVDAATGRIPNALMTVAGLLAFALQMIANGPEGALVRAGMVALLWSLAAGTLFARGGIGGGDLKMVGVTWIAIAAFPPLLALALTLEWAAALLVAVSTIRLRGRRHLRAGLTLAIVAIAVWMSGIGVLAQNLRN